MELINLTTFLKQALGLVLMLALPSVIVIALAGLIVALVQAVTQVQESSIGFGIKLIAGVAVIAVTSQWMGNALYNFIESIFAAIPRI
jgi:type III secretion protein S